VSVDRGWLEQVRKANRAKLGLAGGGGLGGLGASDASSILARFTGSAAPAPGGPPPAVDAPRVVELKPAEDVVARSLRAAGWVLGGSVALLGVAGVVAAVRGRRQANPRRRRGR
jgi:hypothetical protein